MGEQVGMAGRWTELSLLLLSAAAVAFAGAGWGDLLLAMAATLACLHRPLPGARTPALLVLLLLLAGSHLAAADSWSSALALAQWARLGLAFWIGAALPGEGLTRAFRLGLVGLVAAILLAAHGAWQVFVWQPAVIANSAGIDERVAAKIAEGRAHSLFLLPGHYGSFMAALAVLLGALALAAALAGRRRPLLLLGLGFLAALAGLGLSRSLAGALLLAAGLALPALAALEGRARLALLSGGLGLALLAGGAAAWSRAADLDAENPGTARARNWVAAARLIRERPVLGWGGGGFAHEYARVRPARANATQHAHQFGLERAAEHGLLILPLLALFGVWFARGAWRCIDRGELASERLQLAAPFGAAAVFLGHGLLDFGWSEVNWAVPAALLVGAAAKPVLPDREALPRPLALALVLALGAGLVLVGSLSALELRRHEAALAAAARGEHVVAAELASRARRGNPWSSRAWALEAEAVLASSGGDPELGALAADLATEAARLSPRRAAVHALRARALLTAGRRLEAWFAAERAAALAPTVEDWTRLRDALRPRPELVP